MKRMTQQKIRSGRDPISKPNLLLIVLATLFISGLVIGALCVRTAGNDILDKMLRMFQNYAQVRSQQSLFQNFGSSFIAGIFCILSLYLLGLTAWGAPVILCIPVFDGMGIGMTSGALYTDYGWAGFGYSALIIVPGALISAIAIIFSARESLRCSALLFSEHCLSHPVTREPFKDYSIKFLILTLLIVLSSAVDMLTIQIFSGVIALG